MKSTDRQPESSLAIYGDVYVQMEKIRMQQTGAIVESVVAKKEVDLAMHAAEGTLHRGDSVLDCPCGLGAQSLCLSQYRSDTVDEPGLLVTAIDGSDALIKEAKMNIQRSNVVFKRGDFKELREIVGIGTQKAVFCLKESFGYSDTVEENVDHMRAMFDVLQDDGRLLLTWNFNPDDIDERKLEHHVQGPTIWGVDEGGQKIGAYVLADPPTKDDQIVSLEYIPENGFEDLRGDASGRTVKSSDSREYVTVGQDGSEQRSGKTEIRKYFKPAISREASSKNAAIENRDIFYDLPLLRAICEHVGFVNVKCIPAKNINGKMFVGGIVAEKPTKKIDGIVAQTSSRAAGV